MTSPIAFRRDFDVEYGRLERVTPLIRRVVARNPGPFTFRGTGTYVVGNGEVAVIDPGPLDGNHLEAILTGLASETVTHIAITHTHIDHSPLSRDLSRRTGAKIFAFGPNPAYPDGTGESGGDAEFHPDCLLKHGDVLTGSGWTLEAVHTPGHASNHLCFGLAQEKALFSGDHVMGWSTSVISPPDGDMAAYVRSLRMLLDRDDQVYFPTHGRQIDDPKPYVRSLILHRAEREAEVLAALAAGPATIEELVTTIYTGLPANLVRAAGRSVKAHLIDLERQSKVRTEHGRYCLN